MTTSLAAQLKKLALPDVQISLGSDFKQASFLYDDVEAAKYDRDHFYNIGINGLQQLIAKDERFSEFEDNLFSPSSRSINRTVQTTEVNKQLDVTISRFLLQVSPYMQLREAHKAIEWLVNRFNIHLRNVDVFMMCVLPFHDQEPFIMALKLLKMNTKECANWKWLESTKNADTYLPRQTLIAHCRSIGGFLGFLCNMLSRHIEANTDEDGQPASRCLSRVITFFTQTVIGVILDGAPTEQTISVLIPTLSVGLRSTDLTDYVMSSYMIFSHLLMSCNLTQPLLESILNVLCKNVTSSLLPSALNVVVLMYQKQTIFKLSKKALRYLIRQSVFPNALIDLSQEVKIEPFMTPFLTSLTQKALKNQNEEVVTSDTNAEDDDATVLPPLSILSMILGSASLEKKSVSVVVRSLLAWFVSIGENNTSMEVDCEDEADNGPFRLFRLLENKYPNILNATWLDMCKADDSGQIKKVIKNLKLRSVKTAQHELVSDPETSLVLCLHHYDDSVRNSAVEQMLIEGDKVLGKEGLQSAILSRLQDNNSTVVHTILEKPEKVWEMFEDKKLLHQTLIKKLCSMESKIITKTHSQILSAICYSSPDDEDLTAEVTMAVLSYLIPIGQMDELFSLQKELLSSNFSANNSLLPPVNKIFPKVHNSSAGNNGVDFVQKLIDHMADQLLKSSNVNDFQSLYRFMEKSSRPGCAALLLLMVNISLIHKTKNPKLKSAFQKQLVTMLVDLTSSKYFASFKKLQKEQPSGFKKTISCCLACLDECGQLPLEIICFCQQELNLSPVTQNLKKNKFWEISSADSLESEWLSMVMTFFNLLLELASQHEPQRKRFMQNIFKDFFKVLEDNASVVKLLCMIWSSDNVTLLHKAMSLQFAQSYLGSLPDETKRKLLADATVPVLPFVLGLLSSPSNAVRQIAFKIMDSMADKKDDSNTLFNWFSTQFLQYRQEVAIDMAFAGQVMKNILEGSSDFDPPSPKKRKKTSSKPSIRSIALDFLVNVVVDPITPLAFKRGIVEMLQNLDSVECFHPFMGLLDSLITISNQNPPQAVSMVMRDLIRQLIKRLTPNVAICLEEESKSLQTLCSALRCEAVLATLGETAQLQTIRQLNRKFMAALPDLGQKVLFSKILDVMTTSSNPEMVRRCRKTIKHMKLDSSLAIAEMQTVLGTTQVSTVREAKRQKVQSSAVPTDKEDLDSVCWKRINLLFEMIQNKKKISNAAVLIPVAFHVLAKVIEIESEGSGEYIKQLILATICKICTSSVEKADAGDNDGDTVTGEHLNMELIIQCIRGSSNAHTHHQALLLLSITAKIAPGLLLHNMMSVFIFMGVNILRQDNEYSFHVIGKIVENVIPAIIMASEQNNKGDKSPSKKKKSSASAGQMDEISTQKSESVMTVVLRVFVDAIPHIPSHRKIILFKKLMSVVGIERYLWRFMLLYIESAVKRPKMSGEDFLPEEKTTGPLSSSDIEFLSSLSEEFSSVQLFQCVEGTLGYLMQLPEELKHDGKGKSQEIQKGPIALDNINVEDMEIFNVRNRTPKQLRHFKYATIFALSELLSSQHLVAELSITDQTAFLPCYQNVLATVLELIGQVTESNDKHKEDASTRFWKIFLHKCHDLMENLVTLLPDSMFMEVVSGLMNHSLTLIQKRALDLLGTKLQHYKDSTLKQEQKVMLLSMVDKLQKIIRQSLLPKGKVVPKDDEVVNGQTAIYSLKVLCRILGEAHYEAFLGVLKLCMETLQRYSDNGMVSASAMLCIAEVISCAKVHAIEYLAQLMPLIIAEIQSEEITRHEVLLLASITSLQKIIEALPRFLSPYLSDILCQVSTISSSLQSGSHKPVIFQKVKLICSTVATVTATRTFLPALERSVHALQDELVSCAECLMIMLKDHIVSMSREDLTTFSQDLLKFFFICFDLRIERTEISDSDMTIIEDLVIEAFTSLVFKLSEAQFKPMLFQLFTWATDEDAPKDRLLVFYKLCHRLADKLKNLFTLFAGHILKHSAEILDANNKSKTKCKFFGKGKIARGKSCCLLKDVIGCLQKTFAHDTEGFLNKERFDIVMQPIVDQIENQLGKSSVAEERVEQFLVPCIANLAVAAHDDILWKDMNYQILLKTRNQNPQVRMWALSVIDAFHKKLGEDYTQLVPETIPFIAELMEDESDEVEKFTQKVIASMEVSVGENLQEYF